jgi:hypothetical protein
LYHLTARRSWTLLLLLLPSHVLAQQQPLRYA